MSIGGFSLLRKRLFPVDSMGIPRRDSYEGCDLAGTLLCCAFLGVFSKQMTTSDKIAQRGESPEQQVLLMQTSCEGGRLGRGHVGKGTAV